MTTPIPVAADDEDVRAYKPEKVAELLDISRRLVYDLMASGELPSFTVRSSRRVKHRDLEAYIKRQQAAQ